MSDQRVSPPLLAACLVGAGCQIETAASAVTEVNPIDGASSTSTGAGDEPGVTTGSGTTAVTSSGSADGESDGSGATGSGVSASASSGEGLPDDPPPTISSFAVSPAKMSLAGPITIDVGHSEDVVAVEIWRGGVLAFEVDPTWATATKTMLPIVHAPGDEGEVEIHAVVRDAGGQTATSEVEVVLVDLPASGTLAWERVLPDGQESQALAVVALDQATAIGGFWADANLNASATLGGLDAGGSLSWSAADDLPPGALTTALARRPSDGRLVVAGYTWDGAWQGSRPWARIFDPDGAPVSTLWQGEPTSVIHAAATLSDGRVALAGAVLTNTQPTRWDARVWILSAGLDGVPVTVSWENPNSDLLQGEASDEVRSIAVTATSDLLIAGVTETRPGANEPKVPRAFALRLSGSGMIVDEWVAPPELGQHSGALGIEADPLGGVLVAGWSRTPPSPGSSPMLLHLDGGLEVDATWIDLGGPAGPSEARRLVRAPAGYLLAALSRYGAGVGTDITIAAADEVAWFSAPIWAHDFPDPFATDQLVTDLDVSEFGFIHFVGWTYDGAAKHHKRIAGVLHP